MCTSVPWQVDVLTADIVLAGRHCVQGQIPKVLDDIVALRPTLFCGVPRVFDRIHAGIYEQLQHRPIKRLIFEACVWLKSYRMKRGVKHDKVCARLCNIQRCHLV